MGDIPSTGGKIKDIKAVARKLQDLGMEREEAKGIICIQRKNLFTDVTKGIQYLHETMELCIEAFKEAMEKGPLAGERCIGLKVMLVDAKLHEDSIHRGPAQVIPAARQAIYGAMCQAGRILMEPKQKVTVNVPQDLMSSAARELQSRRGEIMDMNQVGDLTTLIAKSPVAEMFGFASEIRSATGGRVLWATEAAGFELVPKELQDKRVAEIRTRKGLKPDPYDEAYYAG